MHVPASVKMLYKYLQGECYSRGFVIAEYVISIFYHIENRRAWQGDFKLVFYSRGFLIAELVAPKVNRIGLFVNEWRICLHSVTLNGFLANIK